MSQGDGGWVLRAKCIGCDAAEEFRGVVPALALDRARASDWAVLSGDRWVERSEAMQDACCPTCG